MIEPVGHRRSIIVTVIGVLIVGETITFLLASLLHLGIPIPLGFTEHQLIAATIVEGLCWIFLSVSLYAIFTRKTWTWRVTVVAHIFVVMGVLLGIFATSRGPVDEPNFIYHRIILVVLIITLALLATPGARAALGRRNQALP